MNTLAAKELFDRLVDLFGDTVIVGFEEGARPPFVVVAPAYLPEVSFHLCDDPALRFDSLMSLSGVDYKDRFAVAYHLFSMEHRHKIGVKAYLPREAPSVPSVDRVWPAANWMERETFDLFGIAFPGSSDMARILLPEDWVGHPLRKDYVYPDGYHGVKL